MIREVHDSLSKPATASSPLLLNQCHKFFCISSLHDTNYRIFIISSMQSKKQQLKIFVFIYIYFNHIAAGILYFKPVCDFLCLNPGIENKIYKYKYSAATRSEQSAWQQLLYNVFSVLSHYSSGRPPSRKLLSTLCQETIFSDQHQNY